MSDSKMTIHVSPDDVLKQFGELAAEFARQYKERMPHNNGAPTLRMSAVGLSDSIEMKVSVTDYYADINVMGTDIAGTIEEFYRRCGYSLETAEPNRIPLTLIAAE